jgi:polyisoprenoid-binding protein YceI
MEIKWKIDNMHSEIGFKVRHMMISNVSGSFTDFSAEATTNDEDFSTAKLSFQSAINSISTGVQDRDEHLKSADFFDAASHPSLTFSSDSMVKKSDDLYEITGKMNIKGVEKTVTLEADFAGIAVDPYGQTKAGMTLQGKINRSDFGLTWSAVTEAGNIVVSDEVKLTCELQFIKS